MKTTRSVRALTAMLLLSLAGTACNDAYEDLFLDPERANSAKIEYLFTNVLTGAELQLGYWENYYRNYRNISRWGQLTGTVNDDRMMVIDGARWNDYWRQYYTERSMYNMEMSEIYEAMPEGARSGYEVYLHLGKIIHAFQTSRMTDLWGDMPYSEAFTARQAEGERNLTPKYDSQESIYQAILQDLKDASNALANPDLQIHNALATQDVFLEGDLEQWRRFANSLRLRLAMRLSEVAPDWSQEVVTEILTGDYPLVESNGQNIVWQTTPDQGGDDRGLPTRESPDQTYASEVMLDMMNAAEDPRIPVLFAPGEVSGQYVGLPSSPDRQGSGISREDYAHLNPALFEQHPTFPGVLMTAAEVSSLKAEAYHRGWASGDAAAAHALALEQSVEFYYDLYNGNPNQPDHDAPDEAAIQEFVHNSSASFDGTLERIAEQRWIHLGVNQPYEAWALQRQLDIPALPTDTFGGRPLARTVRITYPSSELSNNRQSWSAVQEKDTPTTSVWWDVR